MRGRCADYTMRLEAWERPCPVLQLRDAPIAALLHQEAHLVWKVARSNSWSSGHTQSVHRMAARRNATERPMIGFVWWL
jgi:hypothetical protein